MRRSNCAGALQYVPELTWRLFLRILDENEIREAERSEAVVAEFRAALEAKKFGTSTSPTSRSARNRLSPSPISRNSSNSCRGPRAGGAGPLPERKSRSEASISRL